MSYIVCFVNKKKRKWPGVYPRTVLFYLALLMTYADWHIHFKLLLLFIIFFLNLSFINCQLLDILDIVHISMFYESPCISTFRRTSRTRSTQSRLLSGSMTSHCKPRSELKSIIKFDRFNFNILSEQRFTHKVSFSLYSI